MSKLRVSVYDKLNVTYWTRKTSRNRYCEICKTYKAKDTPQECSEWWETHKYTNKYSINYVGNNVIPRRDSHAEVTLQVIKILAVIIILQLIIGRGQW